MNCNKQCECKDCENYQLTAICIIDDRNPFDERAVMVPGVRCIHYGVYDTLKQNLKNTELMDDTIYISDKKEYAVYIDG